MQIIDLTKEYENNYFVCLEDWSDEMKEAGNHKATWYRHMKDKGLKVKLAQDDDGTICGMIQYAPIEYSFADGKNLYIILCIWVHGHKQGIGNYQKKGIGKLLLSAAEQDVKSMGIDGFVAWGLCIPAFMRASWFKKQGYRAVDRVGITVLLLKAFSDIANLPKIVRQKKKPQGVAGKVTVHAFNSEWCQVNNIVFERAKRACDVIGEKAIFQAYDTTDIQIFNEWGIRDGLYIDSKEVRTGPPPSYEKIFNAINKQVKKIK